MFSGKHWEDIYTDWWKLVLLLVGVLALVAAAVVLITLYNKKHDDDEKLFTTRDLTYGAICLAASYALSFIPLYTMPNGGTVTPAAVLPLMIFCYYFGFRKSMVVCSCYMILQLIQKPYIVSPWSALLDYLVPYFALSFMGLFRYSAARNNRVLAAKKHPLAAHWPFFIGVAVYFLVRYFSHTLAGVLFWADGIDFLTWSGDLTGAVAWGYSATYNLLFLLPDTLIAAAAGCVVLANKAFNRFMASNRNTLQNTDAAAKNNQRA